MTKWVENKSLLFIKMQPSSEWKCYLFGSKPSSPNVYIYHPHPDNVPNFFVRWMMKICLGCTWVKERTNK